jgi:hypothetical protein
VLIALGIFANDQGLSFPGLALLAEMSGVDRHDLHRNIRKLVAAGFLQVNSDGTFTLIFGSPERGTPAPELIFGSPERGTPAPERRKRKRGTPAPERGTPAPERGTPAPERGTPAPPSIEEQPIEQPMEHIEPLGAPSDVRVSSPIEVMFEEFWSAFPHRPADPKRVARAVFGEIVRSGIDPPLLVERARAHAANIEGLEPRYWTTAHKWLREECWADQTVHPIHSQGIVAAVARVVLAGPLRRSGSDVDERVAKGMPEVSDMEWRAMLTEFATTNRLSATWLAMFPGRGLPPRNNATRVPVHLRKEFGFAN